MGAAVNMLFRRYHDQRREERAREALAPKPLSELESLRAEVTELRAKNAELEAKCTELDSMLAQATAPKSEQKSSARR